MFNEHCSYSQTSPISSFNNTAVAADADCKGSSLPNLFAPGFLQTTTNSSMLVPSGLTIGYSCVDPNQMIPVASDLDDNFVLDVYCLNGQFVRPAWPAQCDPLQVSQEHEHFTLQ